MHDTEYMSLCLELAKQGMGQVSPNPMVGAVIVKSGRIIGKGYHGKAGEAHAEIAALRSCNHDPVGATLYVNLEPCCHYGQTPPCVDEISKAGIVRVVFGMQDPNPLVQGRGADTLKAAGIIVEDGILEKDCQQLNRIFTYWITKKRPYIMAKAAVSADWKIAKQKGVRTQITGSESQKKVHELRRLCDAILVGVDTVIVDDPLLTVRHSAAISANSPDSEENREPLCIILDSQLRIPSNAKVLANQNVLIATTADASAKKKSEIEKKGISCILFPKTSSGVDLAAVLEYCATRQITSILVEGGAKVFNSFLQAHLINEWHIFQNNKNIGDQGVDFCSNVSIIADRIEQSEEQVLGSDKYYYLKGHAIVY